MMKISSFPRALLAVVLLILAGSLAAACDTGYKFATPTNDSDSFTPAGSPASTSPSTTVASAPLCSASHLVAEGGRRQNSNNPSAAIGDILISNSGSTPCELSGLPTLKLLTLDRVVLKVNEGKADTKALPPVVIEPKAADSAELVFTWENWCGAAPGQLVMQVTLAGRQGVLLAPLDGQLGAYTPSCSRPVSPSVLSVQYAYVNSGATKLSSA
jgi:hypothetical protein